MSTDPLPTKPRLSTLARVGILAAAFLGWFFGGMQIAITNLIQNGVLDVLDHVDQLDLSVYNELMSRKDSLAGAEKEQFADWKALTSRWYAWLQCAFLFGAAAGGYLFGKLGDRVGRSRALGLSILWFSTLTGLTWFAQSPAQLLTLRFLACLGIGGTWPNGVALVGEVWANTARPILASAIGMAGNLGIFSMSFLAKSFAEHDLSWKAGLLVNASPIILGILILWLLPDSPAWRRATTPEKSGESGPSVFRRPFLKVTLVGIALATVPLIGGWGSINWMVPWAGDIGRETGDPSLAPRVIMARSLASIVGSILAGVIAIAVGRRRTYSISCLCAFVAAQCAFWFTVPGDDMFFVWIVVLGLFNGIFFGWLPFFLPELFPTRIRSTGTGVSFNFGRILTAVTLFGTGYLLGIFDGNHAVIGRITSFIFLLGVVAIKFAPDTSKRNMEE